MTRKQINDRVNAVLVEVLGGRLETVDADLSFRELGLDSLDMAMLATSAEEAFDVKIPTERLREVRTLGDIVDFLEAQLVAQAA